MCGILVVLIILLLFTAISTKYQYLRYKYFNNIRDFLGSGADPFDTGDVLMMNGDSLYDNYNIICYWLMQVLQYNIIGNFATHSGVVVKYDDTYVYHMTAYPKWDDYRDIYVYNGPVYQEINKFIDQYPGYITIYKAPKVRSLQKADHITYSINPLNWLIDLNFKTNLFTKENELYCYELTARVLGIHYNNISSSELIEELFKIKYSGPYLCNNLYRHLHDIFT
jgi:hypothetical protein